MPSEWATLATPCLSFTYSECGGQNMGVQQRISWGFVLNSSKLLWKDGKTEHSPTPEVLQEQGMEEENQTSDNKIFKNMKLAFLIEKVLKTQPWMVSAGIDLSVLLLSCSVCFVVARIWLWNLLVRSENFDKVEDIWFFVCMWVFLLPMLASLGCCFSG